MLGKEVIPTNFKQNLTPEELLPYNEEYYKKCLEMLEGELVVGNVDLQKEIHKIVLLQIREAQLDGKRADEQYGTNHKAFVEKIIHDCMKLRPLTIFLDKFQFPLYAFSLYLVGYAFFAFLLAAWYEYSLAEAVFIPMPYSILGLAAGGVLLVVSFISLFYRRQRAALIHQPKDQEFQYREYINYICIGLSFLIPYVILRLRITIFHVPLWVVVLIGFTGILLARQRFIATKTLPI